MSNCYGLQDNNSHVVLALGEDFSIVLSESPTTGYRWLLDVDPALAITLEDDSFTTSGTGIGGGGQRSFTFRASQRGAVVITLRLCREWESPPGLIESFVLHALVQ